MICFRAGHLPIWVRFFVMCVSFHALIICVKYIYLYILNKMIHVFHVYLSVFSMFLPSFAFTVINK